MSFRSSHAHTYACQLFSHQLAYILTPVVQLRRHVDPGAHDAAAQVVSPVSCTETEVCDLPLFPVIFQQFGFV